MYPGGYDRAGSQGISRRKLLDRCQKPLGLGYPARGWLLVQLQYLSGASRPLRDAGCAAISVPPRGRWGAGGADHYRAVFESQSPCGGGGYFRLLPYGYTRWALKRVNMNDGKAGVFYFHPWEIDPEQPRQPGINLKTRVRHYTNLSRMEGRLSRLLREFKWDRMDKVFLHGTQDGPAA